MQKQFILVAGKSGQLARALGKAAGERRVPFITVGRPELDLEYASSITPVVEALRPGLIVNSAAYTSVDRAESEPARAFAVNRDGAARLAAAAAKIGAAYVHVSTDCVFDGSKLAPYREDDATAPLCVYGRSKLEGEEAVQAAYPAALVLRTSWVYSPLGNNFVRTMLRMAQIRDRVQVVDDQHGAPTAAIDLARAILDIAAQISEGNIRKAGVYHLTAGGETTWHGFAQAIFAGWAERGRRVPTLAAISTAEYPTPARRPANSRLDCSRIEREFGIKLPHWMQSLEHCLDDLTTVPSEIPPC
jgi:dTDP-4-dehydrorhamnose reductase